MNGLKLSICKGFKDYMKLRGWKINDVAKETGYTKQQVAQTLKGSIEPSLGFLKALAKATSVPVEELVETKFN